jgi:hypothetical protein
MHKSLKFILSPLKPNMTTPVIKHCADGFYWHVIYGVGPYIADYPEQCLLVCVLNLWCAKSVFLLSIPLLPHIILSDVLHFQHNLTTTLILHSVHMCLLQNSSMLPEIIQRWPGIILGSFVMFWYVGIEVSSSELADIDKPFTASFPCANIHKLLALDLLHQIIKGTFKDHLIKWITLFINTNFDKSSEVLTELDCRCVAIYARD